MPQYIPESSLPEIHADFRPWRVDASGEQWFTNEPLPEILGVEADYGPHDDAIEHIEAEDDDENVLACPHCGGHFQVPPHE